MWMNALLKKDSYLQLIGLPYSRINGKSTINKWSLRYAVTSITALKPIRLCLRHLKCKCLVPTTCSTIFLTGSANTMAYNVSRYRALVVVPRTFLQLPLAYSTSSQQSVQESVRAAVEAKNYQLIPELLNNSTNPCQKVNPFAFLATLSESKRLNTVDDILQSFILFRPRNQLCLVYSSLLSFTLESSNHLPLSLAVLQRTLRSGCVPVPQTHLVLSNAWLQSRQEPQSVSSILSEMRSIGYSPDCGTLNYLIISLCKVGRLDEAVKVVKGMNRAGCIPDLDGYGTLIGEMSELRMTKEVVEMVKEMVSVHGFNPRQDMVVKAVKAMRANRDVRKAVEMIEFLESNDVRVGFKAYKLALEGLLECRQFLLAGKFVVRMTERGFIPYIRVRQRLVEGLNGVGESQLASVVRRRFAELKS